MKIQIVIKFDVFLNYYLNENPKTPFQSLFNYPLNFVIF